MRRIIQVYESVAYSLDAVQCRTFRVRRVAARRRCNRVLHEPTIIPASVVEALCAVALSWGAAAVTKHSLNAWRAAFIGNLVAIVGVVIRMVALAMGAGPRTASNDLYHRIMLALATASLLILVVPAGRTALKRN
jgi:hypothetical protein